MRILHHRRVGAGDLFKLFICLLTPTQILNLKDSPETLDDIIRVISSELRKLPQSYKKHYKTTVVIGGIVLTMTNKLAFIYRIGGVLL